MKENDIQGKELERINNELFSSFDPDDESWAIGGVGPTTSIQYTFTRANGDVLQDIDWLPEVQ
jgi:hypothetical protein